MNNYITLGILPKPVVTKPASEHARAYQLGYFPDDAVTRVETVQRLKKEGLSMDRIAAKLGKSEEPLPSLPEAEGERVEPPTREQRPDAGMKLTLDQIDAPAYMVNYNFLVEWCNDAAAKELFGLSGELDPQIGARSIFKLALNSDAVRAWTDRDALLRFLLALAKRRMPKRALLEIGGDVSNDDFDRLEKLFDTTEPARPGTFNETRVNIAPPELDSQWQIIYATFFREGILFLHQPAETPAATFLELLSRRDRLIRDVVTRRQPVLTPVCVVVADLQDSMKICAELPPEEYFELVNQIWQTSENVLRKYHATQGKHAGDGMVSYFFPQPDCSYLVNALLCADELKRAMRGLSKDWQLRKNWINELYLNIGLNEGEEWFGTYHTATNVEFSVLGETINHAGRLSDFARFGAVWVTKNLIGKLSSEERALVRFGIRRITPEGREIWIPATYSRLSNLIDLNKEKNEKFRDIATLAVAELTEVTVPRERS